jgi:hypothetical protein
MSHQWRRHHCQMLFPLVELEIISFDFSIRGMSFRNQGECHPERLQSQNLSVETKRVSNLRDSWIFQEHRNKTEVFLYSLHKHGGGDSDLLD